MRLSPRAYVAAIVACWVAAADVLGHGPAGAVTASLRHWPVDPAAAGAIGLTAIVYARGARTLRRRVGPGRGAPPWAPLAFTAGLLTLWVSLHSPVAWLSETLFAAHMAQHELLMIVAAPLLVFGQPLAVMLWGLPARWRAGVTRGARSRLVHRTWTTLTRPVVVWLLHGVVLWIWHVPALFNAALGSSVLHAIQHASFLTTAALFWWGMIHGAYGRLAYGAAVFYVFLTALHSSLLGALMTLAGRPWYAPHAQGARAWAIDPVADQQAAGLVMWVPSALVFIGLGLALMAGWIAAAGRHAALGDVSPAVHANLDK